MRQAVPGKGLGFQTDLDLQEGKSRGWKSRDGQRSFSMRHQTPVAHCLPDTSPPAFAIEMGSRLAQGIWLAWVPLQTWSQTPESWLP